MAAIVKRASSSKIFEEIETHSAWKGHISGLIAEKMLRGKETPFLYVLRKGEYEKDDKVDYYITYTDAGLVIRHQPFIITDTSQGWCFEQGGGGGPYLDASIDDVVHLIIHAPEGAPVPLEKAPVSFTSFVQMA